MFVNESAWYYITGIRFSWSLSSLYSYGNESEINQLNMQGIHLATEEKQDLTVKTLEEYLEFIGLTKLKCLYSQTLKMQTKYTQNF